MKNLRRFDLLTPASVRIHLEPMRSLKSKAVISALFLLFLSAWRQESMGQVAWSRWNGLGAATSVASLTNSANFFLTPDNTGIISSPDYTSADTGFGIQIIGFITPPVSGSYTFFLAADDQAAAFLSTNAIPTGMRLLCQEPNWANHDEWVGPGAGGGRFSSPFSATNPANIGTATLIAGQTYFIELLMKEGAGDSGGASVALQWQAPGDAPPTNGQPSRVPPYISAAAHPNQSVSILDPPHSETVNEGAAAYFSVQPDGFPPYTFQWLDNGNPIPNAGAQQYRISPVSGSQNGDQLSVTVTDSRGNSVTSSAAILSVILDTSPPTVVRAWGSPSFTNLTVRYNKPMSADASNPSHYAIGGLAVSGGVLNTNNNTDVILTTTVQATNHLYTVSISGVTDATSTGNIIAANTTAQFHSWVFMPGWAYHKIYQNIAFTTADASLSDFETSPGFLNGWPDSYDFLNSFAQFEDPSLANYGDTIEAWFTPSASGSYGFFMINDDQGDIQLSTDNTPANLADLFSQFCCAAQYDPSDPLPSPSLTAGANYYLEGFHTHGSDASAYFGVAITNPAGTPGFPVTIPGNLLSTYVDPDLGSVAITNQPAASINTNAGSSVTLNVGASGSGGTLAYQWQRALAGSTNFASIPGATGASFTTPPLGTNDAGTQFRVAVTVVTPFPKTGTSVPTFVNTVNALSITPVLLSAGSLNGAYVGLLFNEPMDATSLTNPSNYSVAGATVSSVALALNQTGAKLNLISPLKTNFSVTVNNVKDLSGHAIAANSQAQGSIMLPGWLEQDLGEPGLDPVNAGSSFVDGDGSIQVSAGGGGLDNFTDGARFIYTTNSDDFDFATRVESVGAVDAFSSAALMIRQSLDAGSADAFIRVAPAATASTTDGTGSGANLYEANQRVFQDGLTTFGWTDPALPAPSFSAPAYPSAWIRIVRRGSSLIGYRSSDGLNWTVLTTNNPAAPFTDPVYVGITVTANNNSPGLQNITTGVFGYAGPTPSAPTQKGGTLSFTLTSGNIVLGWPTNDPSQLQFVTNLPAMTNLPATAWQTITNVPSKVNGTYYVTNALSTAPKKFFRLSRPKTP